jgi:MFS superfamily sulfate permease-like transporter
MAVVVVMLVSWLLGTDSPTLVRWLPSSQSMLLRHTLFEPSVPEFSVQWSLLYNVMLALVAIGGGRWYIARMDIFGRPLTERR